MSAVNQKIDHPALVLLRKCKTLDTLKQAHGQMITTGLVLHTYPISRLLLRSSTLSQLSYTLSIFSRVKSPTIFLYNTLISSFARGNNIKAAVSLYNETLSHPSTKPNDYTFPSLFKLFGAQQWLRPGQALHAHVLKFLGDPQDNFVCSSLLNFYSRCGRVGTARYFFDRMREPDIAMWNSMLSAYARNSLPEVLSLFGCMQVSSVRPNEVTLVALITACAEFGALSQGLWAHVYAIRNSLFVNRFIGAALISLYANTGCVKLAWQVFDELSVRDSFCYKAMIRGLAIHGHADDALNLLEAMKKGSVPPDDITVLGVMCACSHAGLVDEGRQCFQSMMSFYGLRPKLEHYCCLVDLLGRAGLVEEAKEMVLNLPMKPNPILWRSLLGSARVHGNMKTAQLALRNLLESEPEASANYVLVSNTYACLDKWDDVTRIRELMKHGWVHKSPGRSLVDEGG